jgi:hypothetical protein
MISLEVRVMAETNDTQGTCHGALTGRKDGTDKQELGMVPGAFTEDGGKWMQDLYNGTWQKEHHSSFLG